MRITALKTAQALDLEAMETLLQAATDDSNRDLTAEEQATFDKHKASADRLQGQIAAEQDLLDRKASNAKPVELQNGNANASKNNNGSLPAAVAEKIEPGAMVGRVAIAIAATGGMDQRAMAAHAATVWGDATGTIVANMEQSTATKGGYLVNEAYSTDFIGLLRPRVLVRRMGARSVPMPDGNLTMRKQTGSTSAGYVGERDPAPTTGLTVGQIKMSAKTLRALVPISNQLIRRASYGVDGLVRDDLVTSAAIKEDQQFTRGVGTDLAPAGLRSMIPVAHVLVGQAAPDLVKVTSDLARLRLKVVNANIPMSKCGYMMSPTTQTYLENLRDGNGNKAYPEVAEGRLGIYPIGVTTSIPDNLGAGGDETEIYFGDFEQFLIGDTMQVTLAASTEATYVEDGELKSAFAQDETLIRLIQEHDTDLRYDTAFAVLTAVKWKP
jgi:HK97 family phage major capsid protein